MVGWAAGWLRLDDIERRRVNLLLASFRQLHGISHSTTMNGDLPLAVVQAAKLPPHFHEIGLPLGQEPSRKPQRAPQRDPAHEFLVQRLSRLDQLLF